jgi:hypothetical protein
MGETFYAKIFTFLSKIRAHLGVLFNFVEKFQELNEKKEINNMRLSLTKSFYKKILAISTPNMLNFFLYLFKAMNLIAVI